jgi:hypothetical protein
VIDATSDITAQLVRVKQTFQIANTFAARADPESRVIATILMDYVAESALKTIHWHHPTTAPTAKEITFPQLIKAVAALTGSPPTLPLQSEMGNLHRQRNDTQHRNLVPSAEDVPRHAAYVVAFLRHLFARFFAVDFDTLSLCSLVADDELREHLVTAESLIADHQYKDAVSQSALAVFKALRLRLPKVTRHSWFSVSSVRGFAESHGRFSREQAEFLHGLVKDLSELMDEWDEKICVLAFGLDYRSYIRYKAFAPRIFSSMDGSIHVQHLSDDYTPEEAATAFDYALTQILGLESIGAVAGPSE